MSAPPDLKRLITEGLAAVYHHPEHRLEPWRRRVLYEALGPKTHLLANRARGWLAILTAKRVLPIFEQALSNEGRPRRLIEMAEGVLKGTIAAKIAFHEAVEGHEIAGRLWGREEADVPWNAYMAGVATHRALMEAAGMDPFAFSIQDQHGASLDQWPDEKLAQTIGDTASAAAVAFACSSDSPACAPNKFLEFWEWWLTEAVPTAWRMAEEQEDRIDPAL